MDEPILQEGLELAGRYRVGKLLGKGGMGAVYEGLHTELGRAVAIKVLLPKFAQDQDVLARFFREARAAAAIRHPGIVEILDLGRHEGLAYIVMERLEGEELTERIRFSGRLGPHFVAHFGAQLADAIAAAHESGVVHRDLKPQNVYLAKQAGGRELVKVLDFGIAKLVDAESAHTPLTRTGELFGTPMYMAPEQLRAVKHVDGRADVYAIGVILREALTGLVPYEAASLPDLMVKIVSEPPVPLEQLRPEVPRELVSVITRAMEKDRAARFQTARELAQRLAAIAATLPPDPAEAPVDAEARRADSDTHLTPGFDKTTPSPRASIGALASLPPAPQVLATGPLVPRRLQPPWLLIGVASVVATAVVVTAVARSQRATTATSTAPAELPPPPAAVPDASVAARVEPSPSPVAITPPPPPVDVFPPTPGAARPPLPAKRLRPPSTVPEPQPELLNR